MVEEARKHMGPSGEASTLPPHYRWNFLALAVDYVSFMTSFTFFSPTSVLPALVRHLTTLAPVIGLSSTIFRAGFTLPQLAFAHLVTDRPRKKPYMLIGASGRVLLVVIALALWAGLPRYPTAMLVLLFTCLALFAIGDGLCSINWLDIMARAIPLRRRGRLIGISQIISSIAGAGAGALIGLILSTPRFRFPHDYALIFTLAAVAMSPAMIGLALVREPPPQDLAARKGRRARRRWLRLLADDVALRRLILCRILISMTDLATPFYVGHAQDVLHLPASIIGGFVIAQTVGTVAASALLGPLSERKGPRYAVRIASGAALVAPLFALAAHTAGGGWLAQAYPLVYVALGVVNSTWILGFTNYMLEIAPGELRPAYVGLGNTIVGMMAMVPALGGGLLEATSYTTLFGLAATIVASGLLLSLRLPPSQEGPRGASREGD